jgi:hypothetical protein
MRWLVAAIVILAGSATGVSALTWKLTCNDGNAQAVVKVPGEPARPVVWATCDTLTDGVCAFTIDRNGCLCPGAGCCGSDTFEVPVHRSKLIEPAFSPNLRLRCRRCPVAPESPVGTCPVAPPSPS